MSSTALAVVPEKVSSEDSDFRVGLTKWLMDAQSFRKHVAAAIAQTAVPMEDWCEEWRGREHDWRSRFGRRHKGEAALMAAFLSYTLRGPLCLLGAALEGSDNIHEAKTLTAGLWRLARGKK